MNNNYTAVSMAEKYGYQPATSGFCGENTNCPKCSAELKYFVKTLSDNSTRYAEKCTNCGYTRALAHAKNLNKRTNSTISHWAKNVKKRAEYRCEICGASGQLEAHHIQPYAQYPESRFDLSNGICLCKHCHNELHSWRKGDKNV